MRKEGRLSPELLAKVNAILDKEIDPIFRELTEKIDSRMKNSEYMPWLLASKMTPESARLVLALPDPDWTPECGKYGCSEAFARKFGMSREAANAELTERFFSGEIQGTGHGPDTAPTCGMWIDLQNSRRWYERNGDGYYKVMAFMLENEISKIDARVAARMEADGQMGQARIIPRYDSVKDNPDLLPAENIKEILRSRRKITQNQCACRIRYPEIPSDPYICLSFDLVADAAEAREIGTVIPWEQAFDYIQASGKKYPVCHVNKHTDKLDEIGGVMCSCTADACVLLKNAVQLESAFKPWKYYGKSRFRAVVDPQKCVNCGLCRNKRCMFDAIDVRYNKTTKDERHFVMEENCMGCGCCAETCPKGAITMKCVEPPEYLLGKVLPDNRFQEDESNLRPGQLGADVYNNSDI